MPQYAMKYRQAIRRKGALESDLVFESEAFPVVTTKAPPVVSPSLSPVSIVAAHYLPPEIQPLTLPGAWTVVGKGGKALKGKMYDEPKKKSKKSKKKARKGRETDPMAALAEEPSSSQCFDKCARSAAQRDKEVTRAREAKQWARYRTEKASKLEAHAALLVVLADDDQLNDDLDISPLKQRKDYKAIYSNKANSKKEKTRRANRFASAAARCYSPDENEVDAPVEPIVQPKKAPRPKKAKKASPQFDDEGTHDVGELDEWVTKSDKRKAGVDFAGGASSPADKKPQSDKSKKSKKDKSSCSVM